MSKFCTNCGKKMEEDQKFCPNCGASKDGEVKTDYVNATYVNTAKSKMVAGLFGIFFGGWGIHNFYLGYNEKGITQIILNIVTCGIVGSIWGFIEGIMILAGSIDKDANGNPLRD